MSESDITVAQEYQNLLFEKFNRIFEMGGNDAKNPQTGMTEPYIAKSELVDELISIINEVGEDMASDERFNQKA